MFLKSSPHFQDRDSVPKIMYAVIISLLPAMAASFYYFRFKALFLYLACLLGCLATEAIFLKVRKKPLDSLWDGSAIITALLLAMTLPPDLSLELAVIGAVVAVALGKQVFGGLGYNVFNPGSCGSRLSAGRLSCGHDHMVGPGYAERRCGDFCHSPGKSQVSGCDLAGNLNVACPICSGETSEAVSEKPLPWL